MIYLYIPSIAIIYPSKWCVVSSHGDSMGNRRLDGVRLRQPCHQLRMAGLELLAPCCGHQGFLLFGAKGFPISLECLP